MQRSGRAGLGQLSNESFLLQAVSHLHGRTKPEEGVIVSDTPLAEAFYIYSGGKDPRSMIWSLIRNGKILGKVNGHMRIYDPDLIANRDEGSFLCYTEIEIKNHGSAKIPKGTKELFSSVFSWSETGRLCGGKLTFRQGKQIQGSSFKQGIALSSVNNGSLKLVVQPRGNETRFEYFLSMPSNMTGEDFESAVRKDIHHYAKKREAFNFRKDQEEEAQMIIASLFATPPVPLDDQKKESELIVLGKGDDLSKTEISSTNCLPIGDTKIDMECMHLILLQMDAKHDIEKVIPRDLFLATLKEFMGMENPEGWEITHIIRVMVNRDFIRRLVREGTDHTMAYEITAKSKRLLRRLESTNLPSLSHRTSEDNSDSIPVVLSLGDLINEIASLQEIQTSLMNRRTALEEKFKNDLAAIDSDIAGLKVEIQSKKDNPRLKEMIDFLST